MKCYYHSEADAVAVCKNCSKGLCRACAVDVGNGVACKDRCEDQVRSLNAMVEKGKAAYPRTAKAYYSNATVYALLGLLFIVSGLAFWSRGWVGLSVFMVPAGIIFLAGGFLSYRTGKRLNAST